MRFVGSNGGGGGAMWFACGSVFASKKARGAKKQNWPLGGTAEFISTADSRCGLTARTISAAVSVQEGNRPPRSCAQFCTPSVSAKDPVASLTVISGAEKHSSDFRGSEFVIECSAARRCVEPAPTKIRTTRPLL